MKDSPEVAILLATYNGEKYIAAQLESLLNQDALVEKNEPNNHFEDSEEEDAIVEEESVFERCGYKIYVHDDGSKDNTVAIIESYIKRYPGRITIIDAPSTGSAKNNFFYLMREVGGSKKNTEKEGVTDKAISNCPKYFFFCDQDDVWLKDKIRIELKAIKKLEKSFGNNNSFPAMVWCDMKVVDESLNDISPSFSIYSHLEPEKLEIDRCIMHGKAAGCSMVCNSQLIQMCCEILDTENIIMHDWALFLIARMTGLVQYIDTPLALYRQHGDNSVGAKEEGKIEIIISIVKRVLSMKQLKTTQENLKRYIAQVASLMQVKEVYKAHRELIDGAIAFENMHRIDKVRYVNRFRLYRHKTSKLWTLFAALLMK